MNKYSHNKNNIFIYILIGYMYNNLIIQNKLYNQNNFISNNFSDDL